MSFQPPLEKLQLQLISGELSLISSIVDLSPVLDYLFSSLIQECCYQYLFHCHHNLWWHLCRFKSIVCWQSFKSPFEWQLWQESRLKGQWNWMEPKWIEAKTQWLVVFALLFWGFLSPQLVVTFVQIQINCLLTELQISFWVTIVARKQIEGPMKLNGTKMNWSKNSMIGSFCTTILGLLHWPAQEKICVSSPGCWHNCEWWHMANPVIHFFSGVLLHSQIVSLIVVFVLSPFKSSSGSIAWCCSSLNFRFHHDAMLEHSLQFHCYDGKDPECHWKFVCFQFIVCISQSAFLSIHWWMHIKFSVEKNLDVFWLFLFWWNIFSLDDMMESNAELHVNGQTVALVIHDNCCLDVDHWPLHLVWRWDFLSELNAKGGLTMHLNSDCCLNSCGKFRLLSLRFTWHSRASGAVLDSLHLSPFFACRTVLLCHFAKVDTCAQCTKIEKDAQSKKPK